MKNLRKTIQSGFTLVELLIVIAIIGTLAAVVLISVNPLEKLAQTRDSGRINTIAQLGRNLEAYAVNNSGSFVAENYAGGWIAGLVASGEISTVPASVTYAPGTSACNVNIQNGYCYDASDATGAAPMVIFATLEAKTNKSKCAAGESAYAVYSSADGRAGIVCGAAAPTPGNQTFE